MNDIPTCPGCGHTWENMLQVEASLRVGELRECTRVFTTLGINMKLECYRNGSGQPCTPGYILIPLVTDVFNYYGRWVYFECETQPGVYIPGIDLEKYKQPKPPQ